MAITLDDCKKIIQRFTKDDSTAVTFEVAPLSDAPAGYLGEHYRLRITYRSPQNRLQVGKFFLKTVPTGNAIFSEYVREIGVFRKEAVLYKKFLGDFQKYHNELIAPKSYLVNPENFIVLEDLSRKGYRMVERLEHDHMVAMMKTLARFHASSIIYEEQRSFPGKPFRLIDQNQEVFTESTFNPIEGQPRYKWGQTTSRTVADTILLQNEHYKKISDDFLKFARKDVFEYVFPSKNYRNVVCHADLWKNNILFHQKDDEKCDGCVIIDYQLVRYSPPAIDLLTALHVNCTTSYLKKNKEYLQELYYNTLKNSLEQHAIPIATIFKKEEFEESLKYFEIASLTEAVMFGTIIFIGEELGQQLLSDEEAYNEFNYTNRSKYVLDELQNNPNFKSRYMDILQRLINHLLKNSTP